jgi:hypothetical protein
MMAMFTVTVERDYILRERAEFEVEADNAAEAKKKALDEAQSDEDADWNEVDGGPGDCMGVVGCEQITDDADEVVDTGKTD